MKIIQCVSSLGIGGAEKFVIDLSIELAKNNEVTLFVFDRARDIGKDINYETLQYEMLINNNVNVEYVGYNARKNPLKVVFFLYSKIRKYKPEVIHSHLFWWSLFIAINPFIKGKHIYTQHTNKLMRKVWHKYFLKRRIDAYVSICHDAYDDFLNEIDEKKIFLINNGVDISKFTYLSRVVSKNRFLMVSRLSIEKNHELVLRVLAKLENKYGNNKFSLDIIGDGPLKNKLVELKNDLGLSTVMFLGTRNDIHEQLICHDCFLLPSKFEGLSISLIEALSSGIEIVASNVGGNKDIIDSHLLGYLIESDDFSSLYDVLDEIIKDNLIRNDEYKKILVEEKIDKLSIKNSAINHVKLYRGLIK